MGTLLHIILPCLSSCADEPTAIVQSLVPPRPPHAVESSLDPPLVGPWRELQQSCTTPRLDTPLVDSVWTPFAVQSCRHHHYCHLLDYLRRHQRNQSAWKWKVPSRQRRLDRPSVAWQQSTVPWTSWLLKTGRSVAEYKREREHDVFEVNVKQSAP